MNCPLKKYCDDDCPVCSEDEKAEKIRIVSEAIAPIVEKIVQVIASVFEEVSKHVVYMLNQVYDAFLCCYPNKRVVHLALYHPKQRVRNKNRNRILRWMLKQANREFID